MPCEASDITSYMHVRVYQAGPVKHGVGCIFSHELAPG
jgi:hypothetical protein